MNIKLIIFDLGKVIFEYSWDNTCKYWSALTGRPLEEIKSRFSYDDPTWHDFEEGKITAEAIRAHVNAQLDLELSMEEFEKGCNAIYEDIYPGIDELMADLKQHYTLIGLSNTNEIHYKAWSVIYAPVLIHLRKIYISNTIGWRKPKTEIFQYVLDACGFPGEEVILLDDQQLNIDGAKNAGMHAIQVISTKQMEKDLRSFLGIRR